jgi:hypothetical protein
MPLRGKDKGDQENNAEMAEAEQIVNADVTTLRPTQRAFLEMLYWLENTATEDAEEKGFSGDDVAPILLAEDEAEMWESDELPRINAKVLSGSELEIFGIEAKFSDDPEIVTGLIGPSTRRKMYLLVKSARLNDSGQTGIYKLPEVGEEFTWNTSARYIVAKLYWLKVRGRFDNGKSVKARIQGTDLGSGKSVEKLKPLTAPVMAGQTEEPPF